MRKDKKQKIAVGGQLSAVSEGILARADELLATIAKYSIRLDEAEAAYQADLQAVKNRHQDGIVGLQDSMATFSGDLTDLMKENKVRIFDDQDQVDLEHGILLYGKEDKVSIPRDALAKIKAQGWKEAIKISESVDRAVVETWPIERLVLIGAKKKPVEVFDWEVKKSAGLEDKRSASLEGGGKDEDRDTD